MTNDIVYDKFHLRHDPKWSGRLGPADGGGLLLCVACVIEMIESNDIAVRNTMNVFFSPPKVLFQPTKINPCHISINNLLAFVILQPCIYDKPVNIYEKYIILPISLDAHANFIYLHHHPCTDCEKVFRLIWYQRGAEVFSGVHERAAPPGPPRLSAFNSLSAG